MLRTLASVSCNKLVWSTNKAAAIRFVESLVQQANSKLVLHLCHSMDEYDSEEDHERQAVRSLDLASHDCVQELHWEIDRNSMYELLSIDTIRLFPLSFEGRLRVLGRLDAFTFDAGHLMLTEAILNRILGAQSPPSTSKLCLKFGDIEDKETEIGRLLRSYVRNHSELQEFEFHIHDMEHADEIQRDLRELSCDNRWYRRFCENTGAASLACLLCGRAAQRSPLLFWALKHRVSNLREL